MDRRFVERVERALANGSESVAASRATVDPTRGLRQQEGHAMRDFLRGGKRPTDPAALLAEIINTYPNEPLKQRRLFHAILVEDGALMRACIEHVFNDLAGGEHAGSQLSK